MSSRPAKEYARRATGESKDSTTVTFHFGHYRNRTRLETDRQSRARKIGKLQMEGSERDVRKFRLRKNSFIKSLKKRTTNNSCQKLR